jgi:hypothetical protein
VVIVVVVAVAKDVYKASFQMSEASDRRAVCVDACGRPGGLNHQKMAA